MKLPTPDWMVDFFMANQGVVRFDRFMQEALYNPQHGYYTQGWNVLGAQGDFVTAPELSPLFGKTLGHALREAVVACGGHVWEFGAGRGLLARDLIQSLGTDLVCYHIVDVSGALQSQQRSTLADAGVDVDRQVRWESQLPATLSGVVIGNEVLDAMPVRVFRRTRDATLERYVQLRNGHLEWHDLPAESDMAERVTDWHTGYGPWPDDYVSEWPEQAHAFVKTVTAQLTGLAVFIDYGFGQSEFYHPQRSTGTLVAHHRHQMHDDVLARPGEQDLTAHVNFSDVYAAQAAAGGDLLGYTGQAAFLLNHGILDLHVSDSATLMPEQSGASSTRQNAGSQQALHTLLSPAEMGELFKVMVWCRGVNPDQWALTGTLARIDRSRQI